MKEFLINHKEKIRLTAMIPAAIIPIEPINLILLSIQFTAIGIMFYVGWEFNQ